MPTAQRAKSIRYDERLHDKLKVIAAYKGKSVNKMIGDMLIREVSDWENEHGVIEFSK